METAARATTESAVFRFISVSWKEVFLPSREEIEIGGQKTTPHRKNFFTEFKKMVVKPPESELMVCCRAET
jgi:regulation of enolase protein 1 (concanavalin A-like superfamily)